MIPGKSKIWISAPPYSSTPGMAVKVVKLYAATSLRVLVIFERNVDLPTEGKPTSAIRASPDLLTSKPEPPPEPAPAVGSSSCARRRASLLEQPCEPIRLCWLVFAISALLTPLRDQGDILYRSLAVSFGLTSDRHLPVALFSFTISAHI